MNPTPTPNPNPYPNPNPNPKPNPNPSADSNPSPNHNQARATDEPSRVDRAPGGGRDEQKATERRICSDESSGRQGAPPPLAA